MLKGPPVPGNCLSRDIVLVPVDQLVIRAPAVEEGDDEIAVIVVDRQLNVRLVVTPLDARVVHDNERDTFRHSVANVMLALTVSNPQLTWVERAILEEIIRSKHRTGRLILRPLR